MPACRIAAFATTVPDPEGQCFDVSRAGSPAIVIDSSISGAGGQGCSTASAAVRVAEKSCRLIVVLTAATQAIMPMGDSNRSTYEATWDICLPSQVVDAAPARTHPAGNPIE